MTLATAPKNQYRSIIEQCFVSICSLNKWRRDFIEEVLCLFLSIPKVNFTQLSGHCNSVEQRFRSQFSKWFDWLSFNSTMIKQYCGNSVVIALDPSYIPKSGKKTDGLNYFWSGCAGAVKRGLEICGIAAIDLSNHTAMHLIAKQTILSQGQNLMQFYLSTIIDNKDKLLELSKVIVVDAYFSKASFVTPVVQVGFNVVSRLRDDACLRYIVESVKTGKRGRPKTKGAKVDISLLTHFDLIADNTYTCVVKADALGCNVRVVVVLPKEKKQKPKIYFSTDVEMTAQQILDIYTTRFQIEFLYRDAKQHTSLNCSQARSSQKLDFHFNASLSAVNLAKVKHWYSEPLDKRGAFSMANVKTMNHNALLLQRFFDLFAINPNTLKNNQNLKELLLFGTIAA